MQFLIFHECDVEKATAALTETIKWRVNNQPHLAGFFFSFLFFSFLFFSFLFFSPFFCFLLLSFPFEPFL